MIKSGIAPPSGIRLRIVIYDNWHVTNDWIFYYDNVMIMLNSLHKSCLSYNILKNQQDPSKNNGDIAHKRQKCRIQIWEKVISHRDYTQKVIE